MNLCISSSRNQLVSECTLTSPLGWDRFIESVLSAPVRHPDIPPSAGSYASREIISHHRPLHGTGRGAGEASPQVQRKVIELILEKSAFLPLEDRLTLLITAKIESGFNPDAAALSSSAAGIFQLTERTASGYGLNRDSVFDAERNIEAALQLFEFNRKLVATRYPHLKGEDRAAMLYWLHHDGPSLSYGGNKVAQTRFLPELTHIKQLLTRF